MSDEDLMVDGRPLSSLKVAELREELENRHLSTKGVKAVLQERLKEALITQETDPVVDEQNPIVAGYLARQSAALAEARKRTESEASGTGTSTTQNELSPTKVSPIKKQTPKKGKKDVEQRVESQPENLVESNPELNKEFHPKPKPDSVSHKKVEDEHNERTPKVVTKAEASQSKNNDEDLVSKETVAAEKKETRQEYVVEAVSPPKEENVKIEPSEISESQSTKEKEVPEKLKHSEKEDDGDELDYGDDEEKDPKDEESMESEDRNEKNVQEEKIEQKKKDSGAKKEEKVRESVDHRRVSSPSSRHPVSSIIHIRGLTRPFTEKQLRIEIEKHGGEIVDFWIDKVKSHCFAKLASNALAGNVLKAMNDVVWPDGNPKKLAIVFDTESNMLKYKDGKVFVDGGAPVGSAERLSTNSQTSVLGGKASLQITLQNVLRENDKLDTERKEKRGSLASRLTRIDDKNKVKEGRKRPRSETPPFSRGAGFMDEKKPRNEDEGRKRDDTRRDERRRVAEEEVPKKSLDQLFRKTAAVPPIYYLPLTDEQVAAKINKRSSREYERAPERADRSDRDHSRGERVDRNDRSDRVERNDRSDRVERNDRGERVERNDRGERVERNDRGERVERNDRGDRPRRRD